MLGTQTHTICYFQTSAYHWQGILTCNYNVKPTLVEFVKQGVSYSGHHVKA